MTFELDPRLQNDSLLLVKCKNVQIRLINDSRYPWIILVPEYIGVSDLDDLDWGVQIHTLKMSNWVSKALKVTFKPNKMNVAAIGNIVKQLHIHHVARFEYDEAWPGPIWGVGTSVAYSQTELQQRKNLLCAALKELNKGEFDAHYYDEQC